jgi:hypothetical protein
LLPARSQQPRSGRAERRRPSPSAHDQENVMKRTNLMVLLLGIATAGAAHAEYRCDKRPLARVDAIACAKAAESIPELRRFIERTKLIHQLYIMDYGIPAESVQAPSKTAEKEKPEQVVASAPR